jgi:dihydroneopterin aldolase
VADQIIIHGIRGFGYHGVFAHERQSGQEFIVDVVLTISASSGSDDELAGTVDYGTVAQVIHDHITGEPRALIERLAQDMAESCLSIPGVLGVEITLHKPSAPIPVPFDDVMVKVQRP